MDGEGVPQIVKPRLITSPVMTQHTGAVQQEKSAGGRYGAECDCASGWLKKRRYRADAAALHRRRCMAQKRAVVEAPCWEAARRLRNCALWRNDRNHGALHVCDAKS